MTHKQKAAKTGRPATRAPDRRGTKTKIQTTKPREIRRLVWDIETAPNIGFFWRPGFGIDVPYTAIIEERKVICICWKWVGQSKVHHLTWDENQDDAAMLREFMDVISEADEAVAHFGDRFDLPWIKARMIHLGIGPLPKTKTIDTKAWSSKNFYFNSNKLDYLGEFLGYGKKIKTEFDLWRDIIIKECPVAMAKMVRYCRRDCTLLEKVYLRLSEWCSPKTHVGVLGGRDSWSCPRTGSTNVSKSKTRVTAAGTVQHQMVNCDTGTYYSINDAAFRRYLSEKHPITKAK